MMQEEDLTEPSRRVLSIILDNGLVRGFDLMQRAEMDSAESLAKAVAPLVQQRLITASGCLDAATIARTHFAPLPSGHQSASRLLNRGM